MAFTRVLGPGIHTASNINSHNINSTGIITAVSFVGNGAGLTGIASTDNIITGTAATFNTYPVDINAGMDVVGVSSFQDIDVDGHTNLDNVSIAGVTTMSGNLNISSGTPKITLTDTDGNPDYEIRNLNGYFAIRDATSSTNKFRVNPDGHVDINAHLDCEDSLNVTGNITATNNITANSGSIIAKGADINGDLDVDGHTNLDNVSIAGVTTFSDDVNFTGTNYNGWLWDKSDDSIKLKDNTRLKLGSGFQDFNARHDGTYTWLQNSTGPLLIDCSSSYLALISGNNLAGGKMARFIHNGAAELYHDNTKRLETSSVGVSIPQDLDVDGHTTVSYTHLTLPTKA